MPKNNLDSTNDNQSFIDLHLHTTASDGTFSPNQVVKIALELKLKAIAITDHDTVGGIKEALEVAENEPIEVIPGIEFSTEINSVSIHIVGLFVDYHNKELLKLTHEIQNAREIRAKKIIEKINSLDIGPKIDFNDVKNIASGFIGRPHIAEVMIAKGIILTIDEAFEKYLNRGKPAYIPRYKLTPIEAVSFLNNIGAIPILAHPCHISEKIELERLIQELKEAGLVGLEIYYPAHSHEDIDKLQALAKKYDLLESGGSDCHGEINNGTMIGCVAIPYSVLTNIKKRLKQK
ncbi:MAG: PHP domain-containing protein [Asgard group archaeon]|nr:PHP domain-containing protein [Asgard group archaeon]